MPDIQPVQHPFDSARCRFAWSAADADSDQEFCVFEFPGCEGCAKATHAVKTVAGPEDPMKSMAWTGWVAGASRPRR